MTKPQTNKLWYGYIQLLLYRNKINSGGWGIEIFPQHYRGYLKKIQIH